MKPKPTTQSHPETTTSNERPITTMSTLHSTADSLTNPPAVTTSTTPAATSSAITPVTTTPTSVSASLVPPDITLPAVPADYVPVNPEDYRGHRPSTAQVIAVPDAVTELEASSSYADTFGSTVPAASRLAADLENAQEWSALRIRMQTFMVFVKSNEAISWKTALTELDQLDSVFQAAVKLRPSIATEMPAVTRLLDVPKVQAQRAVATRARTKKAKAAKTAGATNPTSNAAAPAATTTAPATPAGNTLPTTHS